MKKKYLLLTFYLIFLVSNSFSQTYLNINWDNEKYSAPDSEYDVHGLFSNYYVEYRNSKSGNNVDIYETYHTKTKINNFNDETLYPITISKINVSEILDIKARIINKDSFKIYNFSEIKEFKLSDSNEYNDFYEIPNIKEEDIIEIIYTLKKDFNLNGNTIIEKNYPIMSSKFIFIENEFNSNIKIYNSPNTNIRDTIINSSKSKYVAFKNLNATVNEQYATPIANKIKISYQCNNNNEIISQNEYWNNLVQNVEEIFFPKHVNKKAIDLLEEIKYNHLEVPYNEISTANTIDKYVKNNFIISAKNDPNLNKIDYIFENKISNSFSIIEVYTNLLKQAKIDYEVVISCNRYFLKFDPDFFDPNQLREFLIYLPKYKKYISPNRLEYTVAEAPEELIGNYGIFIDEKLDYYFSEIILNRKNFSVINKKINVSISKNFKKSIIDETRSFTGYWGILNRNYIYLSENEKTDYLAEYFTINGLNDKKILKYDIENFELHHNSENTPLSITSKIQTNDLTEIKNNLFYINVGKVIGLQSNLFENTERVYPIEINFPNEYHYEIEFEIPKQYSIINLETLNVSNKYISVDGNVNAKFESVAKIKNNILKININEFYKKLRYEKIKYNEFRNVINAAAKFYQSKLILTKN